MAVRFVLGRAGTGKSWRCFTRIVEACRADPLGPPMFWIVPRQATFEAERQLICAPEGLGAFCRARVCSIDQLGREILGECGGGIVPEIDAVGRRMILGHLLRAHQDQLRFYRSIARQPGLAAQLDATLGEIERAGKTPADLAELVRELAGASGASGAARDAGLVAKIHDVHLLLVAYEQFLGQDRLDPHRRLAHVLRCIGDSQQVRGSIVLVDGFSEFTEHERRFLAALAGVCCEMEIALMLDPNSPVIADPHHLSDELSPFHRTEDTYRRLWFTLAQAGVRVDEPIRLTRLWRFDDAGLAAIESGLFTVDSSRAGEFGVTDSAKFTIDPGSIELIEAADRRAEAEAAARCIRTWLDEQGLRLRDIAVLMRDVGDYHELIHAAFAEHGIAYFIDRRRGMSHHPLLEMLRSAMAIVLHDWPHESVMSLLKCGLAGVNVDQADELECYVRSRRLGTAPWTDDAAWPVVAAATTTTTATSRTTTQAATPAEAADAERDARMAALRRHMLNGLAPLSELAAARPPFAVRDGLRALFEVFDRFGVRTTLAQWMQQAATAGRIEERDEHQQAWTELVGLLDQMNDLLGDQRVTLSELADIIESGLEHFDLAIAPARVDQVLVGQVDRTRTPEVKAMIVIGLAEGQFPRRCREDTILCDSERRRLRRFRLEIEPDSQRRLLDEELLGYIALTRASGRLCLIRSVADVTGRAIAPSPLWQRIRALFPGLLIRTAPAAHALAPEQVATPAQLLGALMAWARRTATATASGGHDGSVASDQESALLPALYQSLAQRGSAQRKRDGLDSLQQRAWRALAYRNEAALDVATARAMFASPLHASASQIESFATCPFQHFLIYGLELARDDGGDEELTGADLGWLYHRMLDGLMRRLLRSGTDLSLTDPGQTDAIIAALADRCAPAGSSRLIAGTPRNQYLLERVDKTLRQVVASQRCALEHGSFRPAFSGVRFGESPAEGGGSEPAVPALAITTPAGRHVQLHGRIDRIDIVQDRAEAAVIDYKLSGGSVSVQAVYHGLSLQLLVYLLVLQASGQQLAGRPLTPAAAFYVKMLRRLSDVAHPDDAIDPSDERFELSVKPRGLFDARCLDWLDRTCAAGSYSDVVQAYRTRDGSVSDREGYDAVETRQFRDLLELARARLAELADQIMSGRIDIAPYRLRGQSPCSSCAYADVCRFDPTINRYHHLTAMSRQQVFEQLAGGEHA